MFSLHLGRHGNVAGLVAPTIGRMKDHRVSQYRNTEDAVKRPLSNGPDVTHPSIVRHVNATNPGGRPPRAGPSRTAPPTADPSRSGGMLHRFAAEVVAAFRRRVSLSRPEHANASSPTSLPRRTARLRVSSGGTNRPPSSLRPAPTPPAWSAARCRCDWVSLTSVRDRRHRLNTWPTSREQPTAPTRNGRSMANR